MRTLPSVHRDPDLPTKVTVYEVGPRDGLQAEKTLVPTNVKIAFTRQLLDAGLSVVEATSFVHPRWVPQLADAPEMLQGLDDLTRHPVLTPNRRGLARALDSGAKIVAVFVSATETFAQKNLNAGRQEAIASAIDVVGDALEAGLKVRGYISMCFGDPWEGPVAPAAVADVAEQLLAAGCYEISLGDTIGVGTAAHVTALIDEHIRRGIDVSELALHFHDTYGQALPNVLAGLRAGVTCFDASAGGIGGCPFAGSTTGNLATEDLLWMLEGLGIDTGGVDLDKVAAAGRQMATKLDRPLSRVGRALLD